MAKRYEEVRKGTSKKLEGILSNKDEFVNFIRFYSRFYKYSFLDVLCVYVQNENATAVADYDTWKRINYQVRRGEKGIGLFDKTKFSKLRYVFDVSSTYQKTIDLWKYDENKHKHIVVINSNKEDFFDKHKFENIQDENAKLLAFYINRLGKRHRLNLESDDEKEINGLISDILKNKNFYEKNLILSDICLTIKSDLLEIENSIKQYNNSLNKPKEEKEQEKTVPFSISKDDKVKYISDYLGKVIKIDDKEYIIKGFFKGSNEVDLVDIEKTMKFNYGELYAQHYERTDYIYTLLQDKNNIINYDIKTEYSKENIKVIFDEIVIIKGDKVKQVDNEDLESNKSVEEISLFDSNFNVAKIISDNNEDIKDSNEVISDNKFEDIEIQVNTQENLEYKEIYNQGDTVILEEMVGENLPYGLKGIIRKVDDIGQIHINWENGSSLAIDPKIDKFEIIPKQEKELIKKEENNINSSFLSLNYKLNSKKTPYPTGNNEKIQANLDAIKTLLIIESEKRLARQEEKEILANYVGWGGLPQVFESPENIKSPFIKEKAIELKELLTDKDYEMARASTLNAHYTPNEIINEMYSAIKNFGYKNSIKILEPSCGIGNFIGNLPTELLNSKVTGIELDSITGRIASKLYPNAKIKINGFEKELLQENSFDLVVGNVPFGEYSIYDKTYNKNNYLVHDYFINKSIELTKPNGIVAVITSKGTLDKKDDNFRRKISKKAELIGAIRLPNIAFKKLAGTEVTSDILFFQKLEQEREEVPDWVNTIEVKYENRINNYFTNHPEMILGELDYKTNRYGRFDLTVNFTGEDLQQSLKEAIENLPKNIVNQELSIYTEDVIQEDNIQEEIEELLQNNYKVYRYIYHNDKIFYKHSNKNIEEVGITRNRDRLISMIKLRNLSKELIDIQLDRYSSDDLFNEKLKEFNDFYDDFVNKYGYINNRLNISVFKEDDDIHFLSSLEKMIDDKYEKGDFFYKKTVVPNIEIESVNNAKGGLILSLNKFADINFDHIKSLYNDKPVNDIIDELVRDDLIYLNPLRYKKDDITKGWEIKPIYLDGNVKEKLKIAENLKDESPYFERNIQSLKEIIPKDVDFTYIKIDIGSDLYKTSDMQEFAKKLLNLYSYPDIKYNIRTSEWRIYNKSTYGYLATEEYGTNRMGALYIFEKILNNQEIVVKDEIEEYNRIRYITNKEETIKANEKKLLIER